MTAGTTVKNMSVVLPNLKVNTGKNAKIAVSSDEFQAIWNNQMGKSAQGSPDDSAQGVNQEKLTADVKSVRPDQDVGQGQESVIRESGQTQVNEKESTEQQSEDLKPEELEEVMEVLGTVVCELMEQIADVFDISVEEIQTEMQDLGLEPVDLLQPEGLSALVLKLGDAQDSLALLTDEALCDSYKAVMEKLTVALDAAAQQLEVPSEQMENLLSEVKESVVNQPAVTEEESVPERVVSEQVVPAQVVPERVVSEQVAPVQAPAEKPVLAETDSEARGTIERRESDGIEQDSAEVPTYAPVAKTEVSRDNEKQSGRETENGEHQGHFFAQQARTVQPEMTLQESQPIPQSFTENAEAQDIMRQIMDYMKVQLNADTTNLEMQLHPESLGTLHVQVESKAGVLTANFITQNEAVKAALESQMVQLQERFEEQGVKVQAIEVTVQSHAFERNLDQGRGQNQGDNEPSKRARVRRINLGDLSDISDMSALQGMEEEDLLAAEMLEASGGTVDYTA